jgi:hypothetical protein
MVEAFFKVVTKKEKTEQIYIFKREKSRKKNKNRKTL